MHGRHNDMHTHDHPAHPVDDQEERAKYLKTGQKNRKIEILKIGQNAKKILQLKTSPDLEILASLKDPLKTPLKSS